jgi:class 3 adenylate cyclase
VNPTPHSTLANPQKIIADLHRANAELQSELAQAKTERDEAFAQQAATAEVLQVINSSPGDLQSVFDAIVEKAMRLCEAPFGALRRYDGEVFRAIAFRDISAPLAERSEPFAPDPGSASERLVLGDEVVHIPDVVDTEAYRSGVVSRLRLVEMTGARTALWVALRKNEVLLGDLLFFRREVRPFTDRQIALVQNFAAQAVIAMENARLITETREALEKQTATAEVLQVINSSPGDLAPVFDAMLVKALRLCDASYGNLLTYDGVQFRIVGAVHADGQIAEQQRSRPPFQMGEGSVLQRMVQGDDLEFIEDVRDTGSYRVDGHFREMVDSGAYRSLLNVGLRKDGVLVGVIGIFRNEVRPFTDKQIALLQNFGAQAVIAMENARLLGELRQSRDDLTESLEYQTAISDVLRVISRSTFDLKPVLQTVLETAMRLCGNERGLIFRTGEDGLYRLAAWSGLPPAQIELEAQQSLRPGDDTLVSRTIMAGKPVQIADALSDPDYGLKEEARIANYRTMLGAPLMHGGLPLGVICMARENVEPFTEKQVELVRTFADQAVIAIENARLLGELRQRTEEIAELNRGLETRVAEQVDELGRVGRLKRFLAPQLAELIVSQGDENILESHRREIVVVFCDLRGYTAFTETAEPEEVLEFLRQYHGALGPLVSQFEGTLDQFSGDGIMVFFNDPVPIPDPAERAVKMAMAMREAAGKLIAAWHRHGSELGFGAGIAQGYATLGQIGFSERSGYTAIGTVCNLAARLCAEAKDGQILVSSRIAEAVDAVAKLEDLGNLDLRGLRRPVAAFNVIQSLSGPDARPNLTVVGREPGG